ncbi:hypothetical protein AOLI_G00085620 [Acnodon oligacanthus]
MAPLPGQPPAVRPSLSHPPIFIIPSPNPHTPLLLYPSLHPCHTTPCQIWTIHLLMNSSEAAEGAQASRLSAHSRNRPVGAVWRL